MYTLSVINTPPILAAAAVRLHKDMAENMKRSGHALHDVVVDLAFTYSNPPLGDAVNQLPDSFAPATTHAEAITKANALIRPFIIAHFLDGIYAHKLADASNAALITAPDATDVPTLSALLLEARTALNQHMANDAAHNRIIFTPATMTVPVDSATNIACLNAILRNYEGHVRSSATSLTIENI